MLGSFYVLGTVLGAWDNPGKEINQDPCIYGIYILEGRHRKWKKKKKRSMSIVVETYKG